VDRSSDLAHGAPRSENLLVADCQNEEWAKSLAATYNDAPAISAKLEVANQILNDLLDALSVSAKECKARDAEMAETLSVLVATARTESKKAGLLVHHKPSKLVHKAHLCLFQLVG